MSRIIKLNDTCKEEILKDFGDMLSKAKAEDGKISYTKILNYVNRKAKLRFTELAWTKMQTLIRDFSTEVGWHGVAKRSEDPDKDEYIIEDILVYPQVVDGTNVNTNQQAYNQWLFSDELDPVFNHIRFHGHSHVNMSTTPSSVDTSHWGGILETLLDDMFYIFAIWNKRNEKTIKIYDLKKNILFETSDITVEIIADDTTEKFMEKAKSMVVERPPVATSYKSSAYQKGTSKSPASPVVPVKSASDKKSGKDKKRKGKRVVTNKQMSIYNDGLGGW